MLCNAILIHAVNLLENGDYHRKVHDKYTRTPTANVFVMKAAFHFSGMSISLT